MTLKLRGVFCIISATLLIATFAGCATVGSAQVVYSRAEFIGMISDYFAWPHPTEYNDVWKVPLRQFNDVQASNPYKNHIDVAYEENIIEADAEGNFRPDDALTRQEAAVVFAKAFKIEIVSTDALAIFSDKDSISAAAVPYVNAMVAAGFITGN